MQLPLAADTQLVLTLIPVIAVLVPAAWLAARKTILRRHLLARRLRRLAADVQVDYFETILDARPALVQPMHYRDLVYKEQLGLPADPDEPLTEVKHGGRIVYFVFSDCYVQAIISTFDSVLAYSVTSRRRRFRPTLYIAGRNTVRDRITMLIRYRYWRASANRKLKLQKTTLGRIQDVLDHDYEDEDYVKPPHMISGGARSWTYTDIYYLGNPGHYQEYGFTASSAVISKPLDADSFNTAAHAFVEDDWEDPEARGALRRFRAATPITTYTVIGASCSSDRYDWHFGPHGDEVRVLG